MTETETQEAIIRIEHKLDELLNLRDMLLKIFMPRIPASMRQQALSLVARKGGTP